MVSLDEMRKLVDTLNYYTKKYDEGQPEIDDTTWDKMYFLLSQMEKKSGIILANSPTAHIDYQVVNELKKRTHNHPMLSLDKTKSEEDVATFLNGHDGIAMAKMDGLTCSLCYRDGKLVSAETRGNGIVGEDITHTIKFVKGVPLQIPEPDELIVDGEVICTYEDFEEFSAEYKNPRNFASGSIRLLDSRVSARRKLTFVAWDCIKGMYYDTLFEKLMKLDLLGFIIVPCLTIPKEISNDVEKIKHIILLLKWQAKEESCPIDGIVFKYDNCEYYNSLGATEHHFRGGLAFKFYDEEYETKLREIEWSLGKTGQLTPVAKFDDVECDDAVINRASVHNLNILNQTLGRPYVGQNIKVIKSNMIIPQITWGEKSDEDMLWYLDPPDTCPICGGPTVIRNDFLYCDNPNCSGKFINLLKHFVGKKGLDIKGLSEATLQKLVDWGWVNTYSELFNLKQYRDEWINQPGFGEKSVDKLLDTIEDARHCELWQFISSLSIPLIGSTYAKEMAKREAGWVQIREDIEGHFDFTEWANFGYNMNDSLHHFDYTEADYLVFNVLDIHNSLWIDPNAQSDEIESEVKDKVFVITGSVKQFKNRDEVKSAIEAKGGKVVGSVSKNTNYLVNNDINSTSSKNVKAKQLGIPIITEEQLIAML